MKKYKYFTMYASEPNASWPNEKYAGPIIEDMSNQGWTPILMTSPDKGRLSIVFEKDFKEIKYNEVDI